MLPRRPLIDLGGEPIELGEQAEPSRGATASASAITAIARGLSPSRRSHSPASSRDSATNRSGSAGTPAAPAATSRLRSSVSTSASSRHRPYASPARRTSASVCSSGASSCARRHQRNAPFGSPSLSAVAAAIRWTSVRRCSAYAAASGASRPGTQREHALEHRDVLLPPAEPREQIRRRGERLVLLGIELEHALERLQRARRVVEPIAADDADLETARDLPHRLGRQVHLALGDAHRGVEVAARLVQPAQRGVRLEVVRVELADQVVEHLDRLARRAELLLEELRALHRGRRTRARGRRARPSAENDAICAPSTSASSRHLRARRGRAGRARRARCGCFGVSSSTRCHALIARARVAEVRVERRSRSARARARAPRPRACRARGSGLPPSSRSRTCASSGQRCGALVELAQRGERVGIRRRRRAASAPSARAR